MPSASCREYRPLKDPIVLVTWLDSGMTQTLGWVPVEDYLDGIHDEGMMTATTVGYLIHQDETHVILAQSRDEGNGNYLNGQVILQQNVLTIESLQGGAVAEYSTLVN
jgi:hypothetical protein